MQHLGSDEAAAQEAREAETPCRSATHLRSDAWTQGFAPGNRAQWRSGPVSERPPLVGLVEYGPSARVPRVECPGPLQRNHNASYNHRAGRLKRRCCARIANRLRVPEVHPMGARESFSIPEPTVEHEDP